jgi:hypothetical protein
MRNINFLPIIAICLLSLISQAQETPWPPALEGRWDLNINSSGKQLPGWLEVRHSGVNTLVGRVMLIDGSARPISKVNYTKGKFNFAIPPQWTASDLDVQMTGTITGDSLRGTLIQVDGKSYSWVGVRAPSLRRTKATEWAAPTPLFNGKDLQGWHATGENQWIAETGILKSPKSGANLISDKTFTDFKLHIEFRYPKGSNSGIYLRGRYEVQVTDSKGLEPWDDQFSGIYGLVAPNEMVAKEAGEWQAFDITLIGRRVTVVANGITVISDQVIPGITGGALDSNEGEPGPILFQGDHGPIEYRNIIITPAK